MGGGKKETPWQFYYCPYILRTGEVCNRRCYHPDGCKVHRNSWQVPCKQPGCKEWTRGRYGFCDLHAKKLRANKRYHQQKLAELAKLDVCGFCDPYAKKHRAKEENHRKKLAELAKLIERGDSE
ncbi:unnamed protein product [Rhizophagus irregularis]|nr:unnamed protein product [Rhizophagus irregularis]